MLKKITHTALGGLAGNIAGLVFGFLSAKWLGPNLFGSWKSVHVFTGYLGVASLGTPFYFTRELPKLEARQDYEKIQRIRNTVFTYSILLGVVLSTTAVTISFFITNEFIKKAIYALALIIIINNYSGCHQLYFKGQRKFVVLGNIKYVTSVIQLISVFFVYFFSYKGFLFAQVLFVFVPASIMHWVRDYPLRFVFYKKEFFETVRFGLPIAAQNIIETLYSTADRLLILSLIGITSVGFYSLATIITRPLSIMIQSFSTVFMVEFISKAAKEKKTESLRLNYTIPGNTFLPLIPAFITIIVLFVPVFVSGLLDAYSEGTVPAQILIWGMYFQLTSGFFTNIIISVDKQKILPLILAVSSILNLAVGYLLIISGFGLKGVAYSTSFAYVTYNVLTVMFAHKYFGVDIVFVFRKYFLPLLIYLIIFLILNHFTLSKYQLLDWGMKTTIVLVSVLPLSIKLLKYYHKIKERNA